MTTPRLIGSAAVLAAALALLGGPTAFGQAGATGDPATAGSAGTTAPSSSPSMGTSSSMGGGAATLGATDQLFMLRAAQGDMAEISTSQLALKKSKSADVKQLAQRLITDHSQSLKAGMGLATLQGLPSPKGPCFADQAVAQKLMDASGKDFDKQFMAAQQEDHENTIALYNMELSQGQDPQVKAFAAQFLPGIESHAGQIYQVAKTVGAPFSDLRTFAPPMVAGIAPSADMSGMSTAGTSASGMSGNAGTGSMSTGTSTSNMGMGTGTSTSGTPGTSGTSTSGTGTSGTGSTDTTGGGNTGATGAGTSGAGSTGGATGAGGATGQ